jgi:serine/threonine-protein kinase
VAALSHPNICSLYDYGEADGRPYMVLEYLPNGSLEDRLRDGGRQTDDESLRIATEIASGLAHAHARGLVHRDLKPANVLFDAEDRVKIADFGIARMGTAEELTEAGTVLGTASYISPEQAGGLPAGPPSDVYSFGVILYRMLTGTFPFVSGNAMELVRMHRDDPPPVVTDLRPDAPASLASIVTASLAKDPAARPQDGEALLQALQQDEGATIVAVPAALPETAATQVLRPAAARHRDWPIVPVAAVAALLLVAGGALAIVLTNSGSNGGSQPPASLTLPNVPVAPPTTAATTTAQTTTAPPPTTTTAPTTTTPPTTTAPATTAPPPPTTTAPTTTTPPTTTAPTTTAPPPTTTGSATTTETTPVTTGQGTTTTALP